MCTSILNIARNMTYEFVNFITIPNPKIGAASSSVIKQFEVMLSIMLTEHNIAKSKAFRVTKSERMRAAFGLTCQPNVDSTFNEFVKEASYAGFTLRKSTAWAAPVGHPFAIRHPEAQFARNTFEFNWLAAQSWESDAASWIWRYILCLWCHIFVDGNGRLARRLLATALHEIDLTNKIDFKLCLQLADHIHTDIKDQLVVMESQNFSCWLTGTFELISQSVSKL